MASYSTVGVEEEFLLVDPATCQPMARNEQLPPTPQKHGVKLQLELTSCQIETATGVASNSGELRAELGRLRRIAVEAAEACDARLLAIAAAPTVCRTNAAHDRGIYVILDIVLNHAGDVFEYPGIGSIAPWRDTPYDPIAWRPGGVKPSGLQRDAMFRRQGNAFSANHTPEAGGDFYPLKEFVTDHVDTNTGRYPVRDTLIAAYQQAIADYDIDGFRIDTLKFMERPFSLLFGNAMREFALSIGKKNFLHLR